MKVYNPPKMYFLTHRSKLVDSDAVGGHAQRSQAKVGRQRRADYPHAERLVNRRRRFLRPLRTPLQQEADVVQPLCRLPRSHAHDPLARELRLFQEPEGMNNIFPVTLELGPSLKWPDSRITISNMYPVPLLYILWYSIPIRRAIGCSFTEPDSFSS